MAEPVYSRITEAEEMIKALCERQPKLLWRVRPQMIAVYGNETKERPDGCKEDAVIKCIKGIDKAIMQDNNIPIRYHIKMYWSDWRKWDDKMKQGVLVHELLHVHEEVGKLIKHDIEDFSILIDKIGAKGNRYENFPNLLLQDNIEFDLSLLPKTEEPEEEKDEIDEEEVAEKKKRGRPKKVAEKEETVEVPATEGEDTKEEETPDENGDIV